MERLTQKCSDGSYRISDYYALADSKAVLQALLNKLGKYEDEEETKKAE